MKKSIILILTIVIGLCLLNCDNDSNDNIILPEFNSFSITVNDEIKSCEITSGNEIICKIPYGSSYRQFLTHFELSESDAMVYIFNEVQVSGVTINDFIGIVQCDIEASDGKRKNSYLISVIYDDNTEAKLYDFYLGINNYYYSCIVSELEKTVIVNFQDKTKIDLVYVMVRFTVSDNATLHQGDWEIPFVSKATTINILKYIDEGITLRVIAENQVNYTDYRLVVSCSDCGK